MAVNNYKRYTGTVDEFHAWLKKLSNYTTEEGAKKYEDIMNSVVYISKDFGKDPHDLESFDGAVFANGAIIEAGALKWDNSNVQKYPPA